MVRVKLKKNVLMRTTLLLSFASSIIFLLLWSTSQGLTDTGIYLEIGKQAFSGINPYLEEARTGVLGTILLYSISLGIPEVILANVFQLFNIAGIIFFSARVLPIKILSNQFLAVSTILIWTSPVREHLVCHQINGIVLGLISLSLSKSVFVGKRIIFMNLICGIGLVIAIDLKPHLALGGLLIIAFYYKKYMILITAILMYCGSYIYLYWIFKSMLHLQWISNLRKIDDIDSGNKWNDVSNFWPILEHFLGNQKIWYSLSIGGSLLLICLIGFFSLRQKPNMAFICWGLWPIFSNYSHLYDILIITIILVFYLLFKGNELISAATLVFLVIPQQIMVSKNQILIIVLLLFYLLLRRNLSHEEMRLKRNQIMMVLSIPIFYWINSLEKSPQLQSSATVIELFLLSIPSIWYYRQAKILSLIKDEN